MVTLRGCALAAALFAAGCAHGSSSAPAIPAVPQEHIPSRSAAVHAVAPADAYSAAVLASGPLAYYRLDDTGSTAVDSSPNGINGTIGGAVAKGVPGLLVSSNDTAMNFPAVRNGYVVVPPTALLQVTTAVSMESVLRYSTTPKNFAVALAYGSDIRYAPYDIYFRLNKLTARFKLSSGTMTLNVPGTLQPNTTYYVVATYDGTAGNVYVNGKLVATSSLAGTLTGYDGTHGFVLGDDAGFTDAAFKGTIDEVAVYGKALTAADVAAHYAAGTSTKAPGGYVDWSTFGFDGARTGYNPSETTLNSSNVGGIKLLWSYGFKLGAGDSVLAQPVLASAVSTPQGTHNLLYVGASTGEFDAFDADSGSIVWQKQLPSVRFGCGSGSSSTGVDRTAVFDRNANRIYVEDGQNSIHALDMGTGAEATGWPVTLSNATPGHEFPHGGLNYNPVNHLLYATTSSTCDLSPWNGRVAVVDTRAQAQVGVFFTVPGPGGVTVPGGGGGGVWGDGGASIDPLTQNVFAAVGNADTKTGNPQNFGYGENVVSLSSNLTLIGANYPNLPGSGTFDDLDFGATPMLFQPAGCGPLAAAMNKSGILVVYDRTNVVGGPLQVLDMNGPSNFGNFIGLPAYSPATGLVYVPLPDDFTVSGTTYHRGLAALRFQGCSLQPAPVWNATFGISPTGKDYDDRHSPPTVANGVVYISDGPGQVLYAFDAGSGQKLWNSGTTISNEVYTAPVVDKNVYATDYGSLYAFGLSGSNAGVRQFGTVHVGPQPKRRHAAHIFPF